MISLLPMLLAAPAAADNATDILVQNGVMGAVFVVVVGPLAAYCYKQSKTIDKIQNTRAAEVKAVQDARTADAQAVVDKLLEMNNTWNSTVTAQLSLMESFKQALVEGKNAQRDTQDELRKLHDILIEDHGSTRRK